MAQHLLSFDLLADFACFKKPDVNEGVILTFNCLHKPAFLGILGAIAGLKGYSRKGEFPEYYQAFKNLRVGIEPLEGLHEKGNFNKTIIKYTNTTGYANADGNLIITEQTLIHPGYRCYVVLNDAVKEQLLVYNRLKSGESAYLLYFGKNEYLAWWDKSKVKEYSYFSFTANTDFKISSLFVKQYPLLHQKVTPKISPSLRTVTNVSSFMYFERLPLGFDEVLLQYELAEFAFTDWTLKEDSIIDDLFQIETENQKKVIQLL